MRQGGSPLKSRTTASCRIASAFAYALPYVELGTAVLLLSGFQAQWAALVAMAMLVTFMAAVGIAMARGLELSCSCFGLLYRERVGWGTQVRDGILLAIAALVLLFEDGSMTAAIMAADLGRLEYASALAFSVTATGMALAVALLSARHARRQASR